jgi:hypothetical protein
LPRLGTVFTGAVGEVFVIDRKTYALINQWGLDDVSRALDAMLPLFPGVELSYREADAPEDD